MMSCSLLFVALCVKIISGWNQQFGDPGSTSHVEISSNAERLIKAGWNITVWTATGAFYNFGAGMSEDAVLYMPFLHLPVPNYILQVKAIAPNGSVIWLADHVGMDEACAALYLTNSVYSRERNAVVVGWMCVAAFPYYQRKGQLKSYNATNGALLWKSEILPISDTSSLSISSNVVYASGGFDCGRDGYSMKYMYRNHIKPHDDGIERANAKKENNSMIFALSLDDGKLLWTRKQNNTACKTQTKIGRLKDGHDLVLVPIDLPPGPYDTGSLLALKCDATGSCAQAWLNKLRLSYYAQYAFSSDGVIFGSYGIAGNPDLIFGLDAETGDVLFSNRGYCVPGGLSQWASS